MSQGCASGDVRLLTLAELDALRDEMQRDGEWAREELARRRDLSEFLCARRFSESAFMPLSAARG